MLEKVYSQAPITKAIALNLFVLVGLSGCTSLSLERQTLQQVATMEELRYREVLNDLAALAENRCTLPAYCSIYAGTTKVSDTASTAAATQFGREAITHKGVLLGTVTHLQQEALGVTAQRSITGVWTLDPVSGPEKLAAMRAACWWMLDGGPQNLSPDALGILSKGSPETLAPGYHFDVATSLSKISPGWFHIGKLTDVPLHACYTGHSHDTWVWVMPDGLESLANFTLVMQDIARVNTNAMYFPKPQTRTLTITQGDKTDACGQIELTVFVAPCGVLASGDRGYPSSVKWRLENPAVDANLKSQIAASQTK